MRDAADLQLAEAIIHVLDPRGAQGTVLSGATIPLHQNPAITEYLIGHIQRSLRDATARAAQFVNTAIDAPFPICEAILDGTAGFVDGSQQLAIRLANLMNADRRIAGGDLVVCRFSAGNYPQVPSYLGLLKLDPAEVFRHKQDTDDQGKSYITLEIASDVLPTAGERLQKCAFVRPLNPRPSGYDMMLLDRQVGAGSDTQVAQFFLDRFLGAELAYGPRQQTDRFYQGVIGTLNRVRETGSLVRADEESVWAALDIALQAPTIDTTAWVESLPVPDELRNQIDATLSNQLPDQIVEVDSAIASRRVKKRIFRGSHGLRVTVEADHYADVVSPPERIASDSARPRWRVVLETEDWEEVTR